MCSFKKEEREKSTTTRKNVVAVVGSKKINQTRSEALFHYYVCSCVCGTTLEQNLKWTRKTFLEASGQTKLTERLCGPTVMNLV